MATISHTAFSWMKMLEFRLKCPEVVPKSPINNIPVLVQLMDWHPPSDKSLSEPMVVRLPTHICVARTQCAQMKITGHIMYLASLKIIQMVKLKIHKRNDTNMFAYRSGSNKKRRRFTTTIVPHLIMNLQSCQCQLYCHRNMFIYIAMPLQHIPLNL